VNFWWKVTWCKGSVGNGGWQRLKEAGMRESGLGRDYVRSEGRDVLSERA
jgi:hypothetical protein